MLSERTQEVTVHMICKTDMPKKAHGQETGIKNIFRVKIKRVVARSARFLSHLTLKWTKNLALLATTRLIFTLRGKQVSRGNNQTS